MKKAGVPKDTKYKTRHELCLEMLVTHGKTLSHSWIAGDNEMGRPAWFRKALHDLNERYLLAVPSNTLIRDLEINAPVHHHHHQILSMIACLFLIVESLRGKKSRRRSLCNRSAKVCLRSYTERPDAIPTHEYVANANSDTSETNSPDCITGNNINYCNHRV